MNTETLLKQFLAGRLEPGEFGHRDHVAVAWCLLERYTFDEALDRFSTGARGLAQRAGAADKFHFTLTRALMHLIAADRHNKPKYSSQQYLDSEPAVLVDALTALTPYYSTQCLWSSEARLGWVAPDLTPLPPLAEPDPGRPECMAARIAV